MKEDVSEYVNFERYCGEFPSEAERDHNPCNLPDLVVSEMRTFDKTTYSLLMDIFTKGRVE